ncbi:uncharacterized protein LOC102901183 isoform X6 [Felis catus]|uniref:uncharacterized protein LOC102901183 isoform X6 n=1 Tax=Felis catus TaxID=9685 RepID=UPI001D1A22E4|nr:uncharacterized protein LOC102901183 isoform X6 [Felis catus]
MDLVHRKVFWGRRKSRLGGEEAGSECGQILLAEPQGHPRQQPRGHPLNLRRITGFLKGLHTNKGPQNVIPLDETSQGFQQLVQEGKFLEAYLSVSASAWEGQDCGPQYQALAQSMWQVVQQALEGVRLGQELELKLQAVLDTVEYTQDQPPSPEAGTLEDGTVATWGSQLERLLRNDAEARVPTWDPRDELGPFLEKLKEAVRQGLGLLRASRLGARLWTIYSTCFQEVLLSRLLELKHSCGTSWNSCCVLYAWGRTTLFGQLGRETLPNAPSTSQKPTAGYLLDSMMFVTWMSQVQKKLVGLVQVPGQGCPLPAAERHCGGLPRGAPAGKLLHPQNLLRGHFGRKERDLVKALQSLWQGLEGCPSLHSTPVYESIMQSLHMVVFGEYVQALATHLRMLAPRKWGSLRTQVETDIWKLDNIFRKHGGPGLAIPEEPILGIFQLSENKGRETVDDWLASFRDRFPGYLSMQDQPCSSVDLEVEVKGRSCCCC